MSFFPTAQRPTYLVEFNAGKCTRENNTLKPDLRKGTIYMDQSDDQLMHFYWKERKASEPEEDLIIFPDEAEMVRVEECTTGRVYLLKFMSSNQKLFFWMQNKNDEKDEELVNKVNRLINDPQGAIDEGRSPSGRMDFSNDSQDLMQILGDSGQDIGMSQENLMQFLQAAGGFGGTVPTTSRLGGDGPVDTMELDEGAEQGDEKRLSGTQIDSLKEILANTSVSEESSVTVDLSEDVVSVDALNPLLQDDALRLALFPDVTSSTTDQSQNEINQLVESVSFQSSLKKICKALEDNSLDSLLTFLGLDLSASLNTFLKTMERQAELRQQQDQNDQVDPMEH